MMSNLTSAKQPGWQALTALILLVALVHVFLLRASPPQFSSSPDAADFKGKTLVTRSIEAAQTLPANPVTEARAAPAVVPATRSVRPARPAKSTSNSSAAAPLAVAASTQAAPESVAQATAPSAQELPTDTRPDVTPTQVTAAATQTAVTSTAAVPSAVPTAPSTAAPPALAALPAGPAGTPVTAVSLPGSVRLLYKVVGQSQNMTYHANAELAWKSNGNSYEALMKVSAFLVGSRSMTSVGKVTSIGLAPTRFADKFRAELAAHFNPDQRKITFSANTPDSPWVEGVQDRVSVFFQLAGMLAANPGGFPAGSNVTFLTIGPREADTWTFVIDAEESLDVMGSPMATLKVSRKPRKEFDQKVEIWYAPSLGYLPVRNRVTQQNGDFIDQQLTELVKS